LAFKNFLKRVFPLPANSSYNQTQLIISRINKLEQNTLPCEISQDEHISNETMVTLAYNLILGREPENDSNLNRHFSNYQDLRREFMSSEEFKKICKKIIGNMDSEVHISDYNYHPKYRNTLKSSQIGEIINSWYAENKQEALSLMSQLVSYKKEYEQISFNTQSNGVPQWDNIFISPFDAMSIYGLIALKNPRFYVEVGSGNTTLFAAQSIRDNKLRTKIISIDPYPRADCNDLCYELYRIPFEEMDLSFFEKLTADDILLVDNSHRSFTNSDVTVFFTEVLPKLPSGLLYTIHDIFLPDDYPEEWSVQERRWYNEQYLLCSYLLGGANGDKIKLPAMFLSQQPEVVSSCKPLWGEGKLFGKKTLQGGLFWMVKA